MARKFFWLFMIAELHTTLLIATPLHDAIVENDCDTLRLLTRTMNAIDLVTVDESGLSPLHLAVSFANIPCVKVLLNAGASVDATDAFGITPLGYAMAHGDPHLRGHLVYRLFEAKWNSYSR